MSKDKIFELNDLAAIAADLKENGKKIALCHGVFDLIHPGHIRHLVGAKNFGDVLIVTLTADQYVNKGPGRPAFNQNLRAESIAALECVDYVAINMNPIAVNCIQLIKPDFYVKGQEYETKEKDLTGKIYDEEEALKSVGGKLVFTHDLVFSSSKLINEHFDGFSDVTKQYLKHVAECFSVDDVVGKLNEAQKLNILIIGDAIVDEYQYCETMGMSLKGQIVVTKYLSEEIFAGGVLATANNAAEICQSVSLLSLLGQNDKHESFIRSHLAANINPVFFYKHNSPTTLKRRFVEKHTNRKMFEICEMDDTPISGELEEQILRVLDELIPQHDIIMISDFGHGLMTRKIIDYLMNQNKYVALNVQTNSANMGFNFLPKYSRANYVTIDEPELRLAAHEKHTPIPQIMNKIIDSFDYKSLMVTQGSRGATLQHNGQLFHAPAVATQVIDAVGAGDAFFAYTVPLNYVNCPPELLVLLGNAVGALAVEIVCNREQVRKINVLKFLNRLLKWTK